MSFGEPYNDHIKPNIDQSITGNYSVNNWNLIDFSTLDRSLCLLPTKKRRELCQTLTKRFRCNKDNSIFGDINDNTFATKLYPIPLWKDIIITIAFYVFILLYLIPVIFCAMFIYLLHTKRYIICIYISHFIGYHYGETHCACAS